jgi:biopolymer transport protein ExbB
MRRTSKRLPWLALALMVAAPAGAQAPAKTQAPAKSEEPATVQEPGGDQATEATSLDELLHMVKKGLQVERKENQERLQRFVAEKEHQQQLLEEARQTLAREEATSKELEATYNGNETKLAQDQERLKDRLGQLGELFGVVRQVATEAGGNIWNSLTSSEFGQRKDLLDRLGRSTELPSTDDLEKLWYELQREMTVQGQVVRYQAPVLTVRGQIENWDVIRAGPFTAVSRGKYLLWEPAQGKLRELTRQPPSHYLTTVASFEAAKQGFATLAVDPSRGSLLSALTDTPNFTERIQQGGYVGYTIIVLGIIALVLGVARFAIVWFVGRKVAAQRRRDRVDENNPLGRVLSVYEQNRNADPETLELKLDEAVLRESSKLERFHWLVKTISVVAPLLGLLGTVTGMIKTFQAITLFGTGDPRMMAGGIAEALVTTMLGLYTAIPLVLLSDTLSNNTRRIVDVLDEQSAGLIAARAEDAHA